METTAELVQRLVQHLAKCREEEKGLETAYGNAPKGSIKKAAYALKHKHDEVCWTRQLLLSITGTHH